MKQIHTISAVLQCNPEISQQHMLAVAASASTTAVHLQDARACSIPSEPARSTPGSSSHSGQCGWPGCRRCAVRKSRRVQGQGFGWPAEHNRIDGFNNSIMMKMWVLLMRTGAIHDVECDVTSAATHLYGGSDCTTLTGTRESEQPIQRYSGCWCSESLLKN
jgi:hypothetical protein